MSIQNQESLPDELQDFIQSCMIEHKQTDWQSTNTEIWPHESPTPYDTITFDDITNNQDIQQWLENGEYFNVVDKDYRYADFIKNDVKPLVVTKSVIPKHILKRPVIISKPKLVSHNNAKLVEFFDTYNKNDSGYQVLQDIKNYSKAKPSQSKEPEKPPENIEITPKAAQKYEPLVIYENPQQKWFYLCPKVFWSYQFEITQSCLLDNTLVCLPTGLGKTFISTNVMLNYNRWFPEGQIFFLAPTRPLVTQQIESLNQTKQFDFEQVIELTGKFQSDKRKKFYQEKRIFFMTPQTMQNDLESRLIDYKRIVLVVYDEAHRATGKYAYTNIHKLISQNKIGYWVLALTATPGNDIKKLQKIIKNLQIEKIEIREEDDSDVKKYIKEKQIQNIIVKPGPQELQQQEVLDWFFMVNIMRLVKIFREFQDDSFIPKTPSRINYKTLQLLQTNFKIRSKQYQEKLGKQGVQDFYYILKVFHRLTRLRKTLETQGLKIFKKQVKQLKENFLQESATDPMAKEMHDCEIFWMVLYEIKNINNNQIENHPKCKILCQMLKEFLSTPLAQELQSKVIVFTESWLNVYALKEALDNIVQIRPQVFLGQKITKGNIDQENNEEENEFLDQLFDEENNNEKENTSISFGLNQKLQQEILQQFKKNQFNVLIATSVAEEGLDIGEVDLIICYDSGLSPIRLTQRMGRTGWKRNGKIVVLLTEKEQSYYKKAQSEYKKLNQIIKNHTQDSQDFQLCQNGPWMIASDCEKLVLEYID